MRPASCLQSGHLHDSSPKSSETVGSEFPLGFTCISLSMADCQMLKASSSSVWGATQCLQCTSLVSKVRRAYITYNENSIYTLSVNAQTPDSENASIELFFCCDLWLVSM